MSPFLGTAAPPTEPAELELRDILDRIRRRRWLVFACAVLGAVAGFVWIDYEVPTYTARALIRLENTQAVVAGGLGSQLGTATDGQLQILNSAQVLGEAVDRVGLRLTPLSPQMRASVLENVWVDPAAPTDTVHVTFRRDGMAARLGARTASGAYGEVLDLGSVRFSVATDPGVDAVALQIGNRQRVIDTVSRRLRATPRGGTDVIDVEYTSPDARLAMRIVNAAVEAFRDRNIRSARQTAETSREFIEARLVEADSALARAQQDLSDFRSRERVFSSQDWFIAQQSALTSMDARREQLAATRSLHNALFQELLAAPPGETGRRLEALIASPGMADNLVIGTLFQELVRYESERGALVSGPWGAARTNPDVVRLEDQITITRERLRNAIESQLEALDAQIVSQEQLMTRTSNQIATLPDVEAEEARLVQELASATGTMQMLQERYYGARIAEAVEAGQVDVIDFATVPQDSQRAQPALKLVIGTLIGLLVGSGGAFLLESLNTRIRRREEMESLLQIPSVGVVPRLPGQGSRLGRSMKGLVGIRSGNGSDPLSELVTVSDTQSPHAEAFRTIRTNLLFSGAVQDLRTLVVSSPTPAEGKTTTAANLAVAYAQQGMTVLLVDCDLRKARLHRMFGIERVPGLTDLVLGSASWQEVVHESPIEGLSLLTSGTHPPNPSELLGGARMRRAIELFKNHYAVVILDSPPLIAGPDAAILGSVCDGVLMVVRAGQTEQEAALQAVRQLHTVGARVVGAVLNDPDGELPRYSSYYAYQYKYYGSKD